MGLWAIREVPSIGHLIERFRAILSSGFELDLLILLLFRTIRLLTTSHQYARSVAK